MVAASYLAAFKKAAGKMDENLLAKKKLEIETGIWLESVVLRLQKSAWANKPYERPQSDTAIFFSIWLHDKTIKENKIFYNIHALKLRQLKGYKITSREFAAAFRSRFKPYAHQWPNVSVDFGPQTLMEGWEKLDTANIQEDVFKIASRFLEIDTLIDDLLDGYKSPVT
jgi:hypothetical protein